MGNSRALIVSSAIILLCLTIITGMTVALFTDEEVVSNHLRAGDLDITLERTKLTSTYLTNRGFLETIVDDEGHETVTTVPEPVRLAVLLMVSHYFENRDNPDRAVYGTMRIAFENLLYPYRDPDKMF